MEHHPIQPASSQDTPIINADVTNNSEGTGIPKEPIESFADETSTTAVDGMGNGTANGMENGTANGTSNGIANDYITTNGDTQDPDDHAGQFRALQARLAAAESSAAALLNDSISLHNTLAYYIRRNNATLRLLLSLGCSPDIPDRERIAAIAQKAPRLARILEPALATFDEDASVSSLHWLNLLLTETVAELLQDDISQNENDPLSLASWASTQTALIPGSYSPLQIPASGVNSSYSGNTWNLDVDN